jgi:serine/threonine-protein kinase
MPADATQTPARLGRFEIRGVLGSGAMALVYDGWDPAIGRRVAIKTIRRDQLDSAEADEVVARFKREAQAAGRLSHPNIISIYEYGEDEGVAFIAMEFVTGHELKSYFDRHDRFPIPDAVRIMTQILGALDAAHYMGVVHRDIKPGNIYLQQDGMVKVADFGIARLESSVNLTQAGMVLGTPAYMSPEQFMGQALDGRSDLFSAGVILYQFLTGERPFSGNAASTIMHKVLQEDPSPPSVLNVQVPRSFDAVVRKALAKRPEERFQTGHEFAAALNAALAAPAGAASYAPAVSDATDQTQIARGASAGAPPAAARGKSALALWGGIVAGFAAIGLGAWLVLQPKETPPVTQPVTPTVAPPAANAPPPAKGPKPDETLTVSAKAAARNFDPVEALDEIFEARDRNHVVSVVPEKPRIRIGRDNLRFRVSSAKPGYLYVLMVGTDRGHFYLLFPNAVDTENRIPANKEVSLPRPGWAMTAGGPKGTNHFVAVVSENPRDFGDAGLRKVDPFGEFPTEIAAIEGRGGGRPIFAGKPVCKGATACAAGYGAATFSIDEIE